MARKKNFWDWWKKKERAFTVDEIKVLVDKIKMFNAGAIDEYLTKHVDKSFDEWSEELSKD